MDIKQQARNISSRFELQEIVRTGVAQAFQTDADNIDWNELKKDLRVLRAKVENAELASDKQIEMIRKKFSERAYIAADILVRADARGLALQHAFEFVYFDRAEVVNDLTKREASRLIDSLMRGGGYSIERVLDDATSGEVRAVGALKNKWWLDIIRE